MADVLGITFNTAQAFFEIEEDGAAINTDSPAAAPGSYTMEECAVVAQDNLNAAAALDHTYTVSVVETIGIEIGVGEGFFTISEGFTGTFQQTTETLITAGFYTGVELAQVVEDHLNADSTLTQTYTAVWDVGTSKMTINEVSGVTVMEDTPFGNMNFILKVGGNTNAFDVINKVIDPAIGEVITGLTSGFQGNLVSNSDLLPSTTSTFIFKNGQNVLPTEGEDLVGEDLVKVAEATLAGGLSVASIVSTSAITSTVTVFEITSDGSFIEFTGTTGLVNTQTVVSALATQTQLAHSYLPTGKAWAARWDQTSNLHLLMAGYGRSYARIPRI